MYEVVLKDDRGQDTSTLSLVDQGNATLRIKTLPLTLPHCQPNFCFVFLGFKDLMNEVFSYIGKAKNLPKRI